MAPTIKMTCALKDKMKAQGYKGINYRKLTKDEKDDLMSNMKPLNFKIAKREHSVGYLYLLQDKIRKIERIPKLGDQFPHYKFPTEMVYKTLVDFECVLDDYISMKDLLLYQKYARDSEKQVCFDCETAYLKH